MAKENHRSVAEIRADLARNRAAMSESVSEFVTEVNPKNVAKRSFAEAKGFVSGEFAHAKAQVKDDNGWRTDRLLASGGAVLGIVVFAVTVSSISHRRTRSVAARVRQALEEAAQE